MLVTVLVRVCARSYVQWGRLECSHGHTLEYAGVMMSTGDKFVSTNNKEPSEVGCANAGGLRCH